MFVRKFFVLFSLAALAALVACSAEPQVVEVTRVVEVANEVEVPVTRVVEVEAEVTREVEIEVEVTRLVEVEVETVVTATPTATTEAETNADEDEADEVASEEPIDIFATNYLGEVEKDGIKIEFVRFLVTQRDAFKPDLNFDDDPMFDEHEYFGEVIWLITNNNNHSIKWFLQDVSVRVNGRQIALEDWIRNGAIETKPDEDLFSGSTVWGGVWFGLGDVAPNDVDDVALLFGRPLNLDDFSSISSPFIVEGSLPEVKGWVDFPSELD